MRFTFLQTRGFAREFRGLGLQDEDLRALEELLQAQPDLAPVIRGTGGMRKVRFSPPSWNRGKSGATRVCYVCFHEAEAIYLFAVYAKKNLGNLSATEKAYYREVIEAYRRFLRQSRGMLP